MRSGKGARRVRRREEKRRGMPCEEKRGEEERMAWRKRGQGRKTEKEDGK